LSLGFFILLITLISVPAFYLVKATQSGSFHVYLTLTNANPTITWVNDSVSVTPAIGTVRTIYVQFNVTDSNGVDDLNDSSAVIYINYTGETTRSNTSCTAQGNSGYTETYICAVDMQYYDVNGDWTINVSIQDNSAASDNNVSSTLTYGTLTAMELGDNMLNFTAVALGQTAGSPAQNPLQVKNLGNQNLVEINVTGYGLWKSSENISAEAFYVNSSLGATGAGLVNNTAVVVPSATSSRDTSGSEDNATLYFYVDMPSSGLTEGTFNASNPWTVTVR
jgi:hypothetical protein